ncbi:hypothetical protein [Bergeyella zoohelcum]|uniref:Uncharacterized protein n=1 Tax=Bergeyella zoohelcum TaxID=1015 RepID=A0A376C1C4_9FLAO|nr:hypothetical protein [Bergeyella zoohelcum]EKB60868.1 hypothetical protein HMPREF9700_00363 [Bergeyella zoohelcum CCUG 30536]SSZ47040.1 Uncharacterised protein [Bergeyella zoohelcum]
MKKMIIIVMLLASVFSYTQTVFDRQLTVNIQKVHAVKTIAELETLFTDFSNLTTKLDKNTHWMTYYYAGFSAYQQAVLMKKQNPNTNVNTFLGLAYKYANSAKFNQENAETFVLVGLIELAILENGKVFTKNIEESIKNYLRQAELLEPKNLRVLLLKAKVAKAFPTEYQDAKIQIQSVLQEAKRKNSMKKGDIPTWGKMEIDIVLSQL